MQTIDTPDVIEQPADTVLEHGPYYLTDRGVTESRSATFEEWQACFEWVQRAERSAGFWLGDLIEMGERKFGEKYSQALEATGFAEKTCKNAAYVSRSVPLERRLPPNQVPFAHHAEVAPLPPEKQTEWLEKVAATGMTRDELRAQIRAEKSETTGVEVEYWLVVRCSSMADQLELADKMRQDGRSVKLK